MIADKKPTMHIMDGNEAAAYIAHKTSEVCAIYPITPSSTMGELADEWSTVKRKNIWGDVPLISEMQSEGGAAAALHGALQTGSLCSTFTASQGLLLMIPNMYKIAGELTPTVFHIAARSLAAQGLSIFGDHQDIMSARQTGFAILGGSSVQEAHDMALISHAVTLRSRIPFMHFFDGFRTSHEMNKIQLIPDSVIREMIREEDVLAHRARGLNPEKPVLRGTAQNPDVYFQGRETVNPLYAALTGQVIEAMQAFEKLTGRAYKPYQYCGVEDAERVIVIMGSGADAARETAEYLALQGERVGVLQVRLYRPFSAEHLLAQLPDSVQSIAVLDRTKEPGSLGEPLYLDVMTSIAEAFAAGKMAAMPKVIGGRYGLSSKEFNPGMIKAIFDELKKDTPKHGFTIGIVDDVSHTSLEWDKGFEIPRDGVRALFYGLGSDGTVGANKNTIKIIGSETDFYTQGYFVYDSKKSGSRTVSHLRFGDNPIRSTYLITEADFIGCHQWQFLEQIDVLEHAAEGATCLFNSVYDVDTVWDKLPRTMQQTILDKKLKCYVIDAYKVARASGMGARINTIMQTCFFAISGVLPRDEAIAKIKEAIQKSYGKKGEEVVRKNFAAVDSALANLYEMPVPDAVTSTVELQSPIPDHAPAFLREVTAKIIADKGDELPVSAIPMDGTWPTATTKWEKRNIAQIVPEWDEDICIQCGNCAFVCPHSCIRAKLYDEDALKDAPEGFQAARLRGRGFPEQRYTLQVYVEDCTGCELCVTVCPAKSKEDASHRAINMVEKEPILEKARANEQFFETLPLATRDNINYSNVRGIQYLDPLFEFSGACAGCGETPYLKLLTQLFGDRMQVANATGCSSIYGGNLPTTPWAQNAEGCGPAWANSLFEDNAEFGYGYTLSNEMQKKMARSLLEKMSSELGDDVAKALLDAPQDTDAAITAQRARVRALKKKLADMQGEDARRLLSLADSLISRSVWIIGGDGWAYDIGYGGLDHVIASGRDVNILVLDTEVYSNTGGQASKSTPMGAIAKFAAGGKEVGKKDLAMMAMAYGHVYVARVAMGANRAQVIQAMREAEAYPGPSLVIAYSHCIAHGILMKDGLEQQKLATQCGHWPLFRYDPAKVDKDENPMVLDSLKPKKSFKEYAYNEIRYRMLTRIDPDRAEELLAKAQFEIDQRWKLYKDLAGEGKDSADS